MQYADFMGFPFPQHEEIESCILDKTLLLDACHVTSVPPYITDIQDIIEAHTQFVAKISKQNNKQIAFFFGLQNPPSNATFKDLLKLKGLGIRFITIAYEGINQYGGGFNCPNEPLSKAGIELIKNIAKAQLVLDFSHAGHRTARDAIGFIKQAQLNIKVAATHTACWNIYQHPRCLPDDIIKHIAQLGGLIGLVNITWMLDPQDNSLKPFFRHLRHLVSCVGENQVCLGTDSIYKAINPAEEKKRFEMLKAKIDPHNIFRARLPEQPPILNSPYKLKIISDYLHFLGWPTKIIHKIIGGNLINFFAKTL